MKKRSVRSVLFSLIIVASICSYVFLTTASFNFEQATTETAQEQQLMENELDGDDQEIYVPDVAFIKKFLEASRKILTTTF